MKILAIGDFHGKFPKKLELKIKKEDPDIILGVGDYGGVEEWSLYFLDLFKRIKSGRPRITQEEFFGRKRFENILKKDFEVSKNILKILNKFNKPVIIIFGNADDEWFKFPFDSNWSNADKKARKFMSKLKNIKEITYGRTVIKGKTFIGFGGYMDPPTNFVKSKDNTKERIQKRKIRMKKAEKKFKSLLKKIKRESIFILHYPPLGAFDIINTKGNAMNGRSAGMKFFAEAIKKYKPKLAICGHMHEYQGMKKLYSIPVINPGDGEKGKAAIITLPENKKEKLKVKFIR